MWRDMARITPKQRKLAKVIIENATLDAPLNGGEMVEKVGYAQSLVDYPKKVIETEGVQLALEEYGFTEDNAKRVVSEILLNETVDPGNRIKAAQEVFKVRGTYAAEKSVALNVNVGAQNVANSDLEAIRAEYEERLRGKLSGK